MECYNKVRDCTEATHLFALRTGVTLNLCELCVIKGHQSNKIVRANSLFDDYSELAYGPLFTSRAELQRYHDDYAEMLSERFEEEQSLDDDARAEYLWQLSQNPGYDPKVWAPTGEELTKAYGMHARFCYWMSVAEIWRELDKVQYAYHIGLARFEVS